MNQTEFINKSIAIRSDHQNKNDTVIKELENIKDQNGLYRRVNWSGKHRQLCRSGFEREQRCVRYIILILIADTYRILCTQGKIQIAVYGLHHMPILRSEIRRENQPRTRLREVVCVKRCHFCFVIVHG